MRSNNRPDAKPLPSDALEALKAACNGTPQAEVARRLKVSDGTISNALRGRYIGNVDRLAERIRGELLNTEVLCPVLGSINARVCQDEREKPFSAINSHRVRLFRACRRCPNNPKAEGGAA
ncbi:MAG: helix-turn-helix domain-containing protein [Ramlibacter sp.]